MITEKRVVRHIKNSATLNLKHGQGIPTMSEELSKELHIPIRKHFKKRPVIYLLKLMKIWEEMSEL